MIPVSVRVSFGPFTFDDEAHELRKEDRPVPLSPRVFDLLRVLLANRPRALSKSDLMDALWPRTFVSESNLASVVNDLRTALEDDAKSPTWIRTVYGFGYAFAGAGPAEPPPRPAPSRHRLLCWGQVLTLPEGPTVLGRDDSADVVVADPSVSRRHARIDVRGTSATLTDLESKNGTWHGGRRLAAPLVLANGDEFLLGKVVVRFASASADAPTETAR
jgi:hypothetical protein